MGFARFVWLLQRQALWFSRSDQLGDPWEVSLAGQQLEALLATAPVGTDFGNRGPADRVRNVIESWRRLAYINCWSGCEHESHALWRIYCGRDDGVAVQTTWRRLRDSLSDVEIHRVSYLEPGSSEEPPTLAQRATEKRPMFAYEQEVRLLLRQDRLSQYTLAGPLGFPRGIALNWSPDSTLETILVHPEADQAFFETVVATVEHYCPSLRASVRWSSMRERPPV